jgi:hypothetical protein
MIDLGKVAYLGVASRMNAWKNLEETCPATVSVNSTFSGAPEPRDFGTFPTFQKRLAPWEMTQALQPPSPFGKGCSKT